MVVDSDYYTLRSSSTITYGYIYKDSFNPFNPTINLLAGDYGRCFNDQFQLTIVLQANTTYILVVTTYFPNDTEAFSIFVSAPNNVNFNHIGEFLYYLVSNQHITWIDVDVCNKNYHRLEIMPCTFVSKMKGP